MTVVDDQTAPNQRSGEPAPYHRVFDSALPQNTLGMLRDLVGRVLGRRRALGEGERDVRWWVSLEDIRKASDIRTVSSIIAPIIKTEPAQSAMAAVGDDPVAVLQYCIFRRFDPQRNPVPAQWHFDGNILGLRTQMINTWFPLQDVGVTAPGLTLVCGARRPQALWQRLEDIADENGMFTPQARQKALFEDADVEAAVDADPEAEFVTPVVPAGGAIAFDHLYLHGTQRLTPEMGVRESFEFRVMSERVAHATGLDHMWAMVRLY